MSTSIWDDEALQAPPEPNFVKLDKVGDGFSGVIVRVSKVKFEDDSVAPQIDFIDDITGEQRTYTVGQTDAKRKCAEIRPGERDHIIVKYTGTSGKFKHVDVTVDRRAGDQQAAPQASASLPTYQKAEPPVYARNTGAAGAEPVAITGEPPAGIAPAVWARMSTEQRATLTAVTPAF